MIKKYTIYTNDGREVHGTGCYCLYDVEHYCNMFGLRFTTEDYVEPSLDDPYYFVYQRCLEAQQYGIN